MANKLQDLQNLEAASLSYCQEKKLKVNFCNCITIKYDCSFASPSKTGLKFWSVSMIQIAQF